jgi:hypothetical protein
MERTPVPLAVRYSRRVMPHSHQSPVLLSRCGLAVLLAGAACGSGKAASSANLHGDAGTAGDGSSSLDDAAAPESGDAAPSEIGAFAPNDAEGDVGAAASCDLGSAGSFATQQSLDLFGQIVYFDNGKMLPAGHYRVQYVDGCMKYSSAQDWAVQAYADGSDAFWLVGATSANRILILPGTVGFMVGSGGFATFDECVAANLALPPEEFDFAGGPIGVWLSDSPYSDNVAGTGGRNPKWSLTLLGDCSQIR